MAILCITGQSEERWYNWNTCRNIRSKEQIEFEVAFKLELDINRVEERHVRWKIENTHCKQNRVCLHLGDYILTYFKKYDVRGKWRFVAQQKAET